jgi:hypothetical protein
MIEDAMDEFERDRQERMLPYPYTYTFYTLEHFLDNHNFDIRYCNIGKGRIIAHYDDSNLLIRGHEGHIDVEMEANGDDTVLSMSTSYYNSLNDEDLFKFRKDFITTVQLWLEREYTMILPQYPGDIPRFRQNNDGAAMIDRSVDLKAPDTLPLSKQLIYLGSSMMIGGIIIDVLIGFMPSFWGMNIAILTGLPFMIFAVMVGGDDFESAMKHYSLFGWMAGLIFCTFTLFIGVIIVVFPAVMVDYHATRIRVWNGYIDDIEGKRAGAGPASLTQDLSDTNRGRTPEVNVVGGMI